jgi:hypothetical protein
LRGSFADLRKSSVMRDCQPWPGGAVMRPDIGVAANPPPVANDDKAAAEEPDVKAANFAVIAPVVPADLEITGECLLRVGEIGVKSAACGP